MLVLGHAGFRADGGAVLGFKEWWGRSIVG